MTDKMELIQPNLVTQRLVLRPFRASDSGRVAELAGDRRVAEMTANIPYPYHPAMAVSWIQTHKVLFQQRQEIVYAITFKDHDQIVGAVGMTFPSQQVDLGILGYWLSVSFWGRGVAYEAAQALLDYCKQQHGLKRLFVEHLVSNERSKSVIRKLGVAYLENRIIQVRGEPHEVCVYLSTASDLGTS